jgi:BlaI family transcriptional regulator, penicillinase repressor
MARRKTKTLTEVELEFMQIIWEKGEATPEDISTELIKINHPISGGSIRNVLAIMSEKGYITRRKRSKTYLYAAKVGKDDASKSMVMDILTRVFGGSESMMVSSILKKEDIKKDELEHIERLIAERKKEI